MLQRRSSREVLGAWQRRVHVGQGIKDAVVILLKRSAVNPS
jgi:hypothetical protein